MSNPYEGSQHYFNIMGTTIGTGVPYSMKRNGWQFRDHSKASRTIWQYTRHLDNGRYDEITLEEHKKEGVHVKVKKMMKKEEKPTIEQFIHEIAPQLKNSVEEAFKKDKSSTPFLSIMKLCSQCGSEVSANSKSCPICGKCL